TKIGSPQERANVLFQNPAVDVAILKPTPRTLLRDGFGNDRCDVALILDARPAEEPPEADLGPEPAAFVQTLRHALPSSGVFVLPVEGLTAGLDGRLPAARIILVAGQEEHPAVRDHLTAGGRALFVQGERLMLAQGHHAPVALGNRPGG